MHDADVPEPQAQAQAQHGASLEAAVEQLFGGLDPDVLAEIRGSAEVRVLHGGQVLFREGDPGDAAFHALSARSR
jgi:hypothetical protein